MWTCPSLRCSSVTRLPDKDQIDYLFTSVPRLLAIPHKSPPAGCLPAASREYQLKVLLNLVLDKLAGKPRLHAFLQQLNRLLCTSAKAPAVRHKTVVIRDFWQPAVVFRYVVRAPAPGPLTIVLAAPADVMDVVGVLELFFEAALPRGVRVLECADPEPALAELRGYDADLALIPASPA